LNRLCAFAAVGTTIAHYSALSGKGAATMTQTGSSTFKFTTVADQIQRARAGEVTKWLVPGVLVAGGSTLLYAPPGHGKSLVAMDLAIAASHGREWLGIHKLGDPMPVLYVDDDGNNDHEFNARLLRFGADEDNPHLHCMLHNGFNITNDEQRKELLAWCEENGIRLMIADSLTRIHQKTESSAGDMKIVNSCIKEFCAAGISVVMLHHAAKNGRTFRGSSEITSAYDGVLHLEKSGADRFKMRSEKVRSVGPDGVWPGCEIAVTIDENDRMVLDGSLPLSDEHSDEHSEKTDTEPMSQKIKELLWDGEKNATTLKKVLKLSSRDYPAFDVCLAQLVAEGTVEYHKVGKATVYSLR
jgi:hypothetical protein